MASTSGAETTGAGRRFNLVRILGEGAFGSVYLAEMEGAGGFKRRVALKLLNDAWDPASDAGRRLRDEARLLGRLDHANIVRVDDLVRVNGRWALVMEYVSGADVEAVFAWAETNAAPIPPRAALEVCASVAAALQAAWCAPGDDGEPLHVVHRDIKPSNVRLTDTGSVKVLDFGVARAEFAGREAQTERIRYGSLGYMAPERILGGPDAPAGDVYAVAVMAYELLTLKTFGRAELGFERQVVQVDSARDILEAVVGDGPLVVLLVRALAYTPEDRPSVEELATGLRGFAAALPGDDLPAYARRVLPRLPNTRATDTAVSGTVLEEASLGSTTLEMHARVSSATLVVDPSGLGGFGSLETEAAPDPEPPPPASRGFVYGVAFVAAVLVLAIGWLVWPTAPLPEAPTADVAPAAPIEPALAVAPTPPPTEITEGAGTDAVALVEPVTPLPVPTATKAPRVEARAAPVTVAAAPTAPEATVAPTAASAPRLRAAKFTLAGAEGIRVTCGDVSGTGDTSTLLRNFPVGDCTVSAAGSTTTVRLDTPRGVDCAVEGDSLTCR
ncbi:MAG: serine/threonine-protein kinase [Myxococcota bacterium]